MEAGLHEDLFGICCWSAALWDLPVCEEVLSLEVVQTWMEKILSSQELPGGELVQQKQFIENEYLVYYHVWTWGMS